MPATMPAFSFTGLGLRYRHSRQSKQSAQQHQQASHWLYPPGWQRLDAPHPVRPGDSCEVRSFHSPNFNCVFLCPRHPSVGLEQLDMKPLRRERQRDEYVDPFGAGWKVCCDLVRRRDGQPNLPSDVERDHRQQDMGLSRSERLTQHGSRRTHELKHPAGHRLKLLVLVQRVPRARSGQVDTQSLRARDPSTAPLRDWRERLLLRRRG